MTGPSGKYVSSNLNKFVVDKELFPWSGRLAQTILRPLSRKKISGES